MACAALASGLSTPLRTTLSSRPVRPIEKHFRKTFVKMIFFLCFTFGSAGSSLLSRPFSSYGEPGLRVSCSVWASYRGFSLVQGAGCEACGLQQLWLLGFRAQARWLWRMGFVALWLYDLPGSGIEPVSPALAGGFFNHWLPGKPGWFQIGKGVRQGCMLSPCLFNLYAEYNM